MSELTHLGSQSTKYNYDKPDADILETFKNKHTDALYLIPFVQERDEFTSLCPVTGQPDFASFEIIYIPNELCVESKSLKLYLMSFRNHGEFHEDVTNRIAKDIFDKIHPLYIRVFGNFASRGGLAIKPLVMFVDDPNDNRIDAIKWLISQWDTKL